MVEKQSLSKSTVGRYRTIVDRFTDCKLTIPLSALLLSDGRPGHFNLAEGILAAAQRLRPVAITRLEVRRGQWPGVILAAWSNSGKAPASLLRLVHDLERAALPKADLVVSAGAETLAANVACARILGAANIFYGSLRRFNPAAFSLALTSYANDCWHPHQAFALKPSPAALLAWQRRAADTTRSINTIGLLIGGQSGETTYSDADWQRLLDIITAIGARGFRWYVANSRRTPPDIGDRLTVLAADRQSPIARFIDARLPDAPTLMPVLEQAALCFVTDDSSSMVSEAIAAGLPVVGLCPADHHLNERERGYRKTLQDNGWYAARSLTTPAEELIDTALRLTPRTEDPASDIAGLLTSRLPRLFLGGPFPYKRLE